VTRYILSPEAQQDLRDIREYLHREAGLTMARHVLREITTAMRFLSFMPGAGHLRQDLTAEPVKFWQVFAYLIVYDPVARPIGIARVLHGSRDVAAILGRSHSGPRAG
jgi:plasmid stabilization system protein ParE